MRHQWTKLPLSTLFLLGLTGCTTLLPKDPDIATMAQEMRTSELGLAEATIIATRTASGVAAEARTHKHSSNLFYEIKILTPRETNFVSVDASTGLILDENKRWAQARRLEKRDKAERLRLERASIILPEAIAIAEQKSGGRAFWVDVDNHKYPQRFQIKTIKDASISTVNVELE